jgi:serine/threonine protein kinase/Flp pilus assembly protein TadD
MADVNTGAESATRAKPTDAGSCSRCGRPLTQLGPNGECLRCLFDWGATWEEEQSQRDAGVAPGPLRYGHFMVEADTSGFPIALGAGAMAVTYRARDTVLNSIVALKVIGRKLAENPIARARFLREARAAAQIHHPNVARVTHYGEQNGEYFYAMELVEGETLQARVRRTGPLPLSLALEVIEQAARGLAAAEAGGVVHRDLKPSNLMIASDASELPLVKIIDYGVAKVVASQTDTIDQTQAGFIGTPAFASPEQFAEPGKTRIDTRSDIYSLGVTLWYLLTRQMPFGGETLEQIRSGREELPLEQLKAVHVPAKVIALLKSMLAVDPAKRPQTARELLAAVHRCHEKFEPRARLRRKHLILAAAGSALFLTALIIATLLYERAQSFAEMERSIAVLPFENLSPNGEDAYFTVGIQDEITSDLASLAGLKVVGSQSTRSYAPGKDRDLQAIARQLGVRHLLQGDVTRDNGQMRVALQLVDLRHSAHPWTKAYQGPMKDVFALEGEITRDVAAQLQRQLSPNEKAVLDTPPTTDLRAYDLYLQARAISSATLGAEHGRLWDDVKGAIPMLEEAIARDPNFVLAYCELAKWHDEIYFVRTGAPPEALASALTIDHRALSEAALEKARRLQPESGAVHLALARHALQIDRNVEEADIQIQLARRSLPNDGQVEAIAGRVARRQDRWDDALRCFERATSLEPRDRTLRAVLAETYRAMRRYQEYDRAIENLLALTPADKLGIVPIERAWARLEYSADIAPLREAFATQIAAHQLDETDIANGQLMIALWSHDATSISRILSAKHDIAGWAGFPFPDAWFEALAARIRGDKPAASKAFADARPKMEEQVQLAPTDGSALSFLAIIDAGLGRTEQAVEEGKRACELYSFKTYNVRAPLVRCNLAVVYAWTGKNDLAIAELTPLIDRPAGVALISQPTYGDFRLNPLWDPLRSDPRFEALVQRLAPTASK